MRVIQIHYTITTIIKKGQITVKASKLSVHGYNLFDTTHNPIELIYKKDDAIPLFARFYNERRFHSLKKIQNLKQKFAANSEYTTWKANIKGLRNS